MNGLQFLALFIASATLYWYATHNKRNNMQKGTNTNPVLDAFREGFDSYDPFGSAIGALFDIAECLHRYGAGIPSAWEFSPSVALHVGDEFDEENESYFAAQCDLFMREGHYSNLVHAGNVLDRYITQLKLAGKDY